MQETAPNAIPESDACCWVMPERETGSFRFCDAPTAPSYVFCPEHAALTPQRPLESRGLH